MVTPVDLALYDRLPIHRIASPRPVDLAQPPAAAAAPDGSGVSAVGAAPSQPLMTSAMAGQLLGIDPQWIGGASALAQAKAAGAYGLASMQPVATLTPTAPRFAYEEVSGLGYFPGDTSRDAASMTAHVRGQVANAREAARREQQLSDAAGVEIRLAYDPNRDQAVALRPDDEGYDQVKGARAAFERMAWDIQKMGLDVRDFASLLQP